MAGEAFGFGAVRLVKEKFLPNPSGPWRCSLFASVCQSRNPAHRSHEDSAANRLTSGGIRSSSPPRPVRGEPGTSLAGKVDPVRRVRRRWCGNPHLRRLSCLASSLRRAVVVRLAARAAQQVGSSVVSLIAGGEMGLVLICGMPTSAG